MDKVCGYVIVRKPEWCREEISHMKLILEPPQVGQIFYSGVDRMMWEDFDAAHYQGSLPQELEIHWKDIYSSRPHDSPFMLSHDRNIVNKILKYCNRHTEMNEIIVLRSDRLGEIYGSISAPSNLCPLGTDIYVSGYGSMVREGIFRSEEIFDDFVEKLNKHGLLNDKDNIDKYVRFYNSISVENNLEKFPNSTDLCFYLEILRLSSLES